MMNNNEAVAKLRRSIETLRETPEKVRSLLRGIGDEEMRWRPKGDFFSIRENVHHLRDIEVEGYATRLRRLLSEESPVLADIDGAALSRSRRYNDGDEALALRQFAASRAENVRILEDLLPENLSRSGELEKVGPITLGRLLEMWVEHDAGHVEEIRDLRARAREAVAHPEV
jgi:hypothetical protein